MGARNMLTISNQQLLRLDFLGQQRYRARLSICLREDFPDETADLSDDDLDILLSLILLRAEALDITSEDSMFVYAAMSIFLGMNFVEHPAVDAILFSSDASPDEAMCEVPFLLTGEDFRDIAEQSLSAASLLRETRARIDALSAANKVGTSDP